MGLKKMLILLGVGFAVVVALGVYVVVVEMKAPTTEEVMKERGLVFKYKDDKSRTIPDVATKLEIQRDKDTVVIEKADAQNWRLRKPVDARADRSSVLAILTDIKNLRVESVVTPEGDKPEDVEKFGLKAPRIKAAFWIGDTRHDIAVGAEVKGQSAYQKKAYIRVGDRKQLYVVDNPLIEKLDKKPSDFRDKKVFERTRDPEKAKALRLVSAKQTLAVEKDKKTWQLKAPVADSADDSKVNGLLTKARNLDVEDFVTEDAAKLADYGLDKPQLTCELKADDDATMTLLVGTKSKDDDRKLYAKRGEEPSIFTIKSDFLSDMEVKLDDVRLRKVADIDEDDVTGVELVKGKATWAVTRTNSGEDWKLTKPKEAKASDSAADDFVRDLKRLRVARWVDDPKDKAFEALKTPAAVITITRDSEGKSSAKKGPAIKLSLSAPVKKTKKKKEKGKEVEEVIEQGRYVQRDGQKCLLFVSTKKPDDAASSDDKDSAESASDIAKSLAKGYLAFLDRKVFHFDDTHVTKLEIERDGTKLVCEKDGENWKLAAPVKLDADKSNVSTILNAMDSLEADEYVAEAPKDLKPYGLDKPALRLVATITEEVKDEAKDDEKKDDKDKKPDEKKKEPTKKTYTKALLVSRKIDDKTYAMEQGGKLVFILKSWDVASLRTEPISTTIGDFADTDATSVAIAHRGKPEIVLEKDKDTWKLVKPKKAEPDQDAVKKVIDALHDLRTRRYVDYEAKDLNACGLDPAATVVTVKIKDKSDFVLKIGKPVPGEKTDPGSYAVAGGKKQVFLMAKTKVEDVAKQLKDLEKKPPEPKKDAQKDKKNVGDKPEATKGPGKK